jgi:hypothetical protein
MKKLTYLITILFVCLVASTTLIAEDIAGLEITNFKFGYFENIPNGHYEAQSGKKYTLHEGIVAIPFVYGNGPGFAFDFENKSGRNVEIKEEWILPGVPGEVSSSDSDAVIGHEGNVVVFTNSFEKGSSLKDYFSVARLAPGDPMGKYFLKIWIGGKLFKTVEFNVVKP